MRTNVRKLPTMVEGSNDMGLASWDLPSSQSARWTSRRKAKVVEAVHGGLLVLERACEKYALTREEFRSWERALKQSGLPGLKAGSVQRLKRYPSYHRH
jgi:hypothetical protein